MGLGLSWLVVLYLIFQSIYSENAYTQFELFTAVVTPAL